MFKPQETQHVGMAPIPMNVNRVSELLKPRVPTDSDIEVIDLDNPRDQIKPTTWHG